MRRAGRLLFALALAVPLFASACGSSQATALAQKIVFDLATVAFTADRQFTADLDGQHVDWTERVKSAGDGKSISVELIARNGLRRDQITDPLERAAFDRLAGQLAAGGGARVLNQRDPAPDDVQRMVDNYYVTLIELRREPLTPNGEPTLTFRLEPICADRPFYVLTVSTRADHAGFPIECQEYLQETGGARLVSDMQVTALDWGVPEDVVAPPTAVVSRLALDSLDAAKLSAAARGLSLYLPQDGSLPVGFELVKAEEVQYQTDANSTRTLRTIPLYRFVYSDGIEHIDFIEHAPPDTLPQKFLMGNNGQGIDLALVSQFGSISTGSLLHGGTLITIESRVAADRFDAMMKALVQL